jgi:hypothetical protein
LIISLMTVVANRVVVTDITPQFELTLDDAGVAYSIPGPGSGRVADSSNSLFLLLIGMGSLVLLQSATRRKNLGMAPNWSPLPCA